MKYLIQMVYIFKDKTDVIKYQLEKLINNYEYFKL